MHEDALVAAPLELLKSIAATSEWVAALALLATWYGAQETADFELLGIKFRRSIAFVVATAIYLTALLLVAFQLWRLGDMMMLVPPHKVEHAFSNLAAHAWPCNPFMYAGSTLAARVQTYAANLAFITLLYLSSLSIFFIVPDRRSRPARIASLCVIGGVAICSNMLAYAQNAIVEVLLRANSPLADPYKAVLAPRELFVTVVCVVVGPALMIALMMFQHSERPGA